MNEYFTSVVAVFLLLRSNMYNFFLRKLNATFSRNQFLFIHFRCFFVGSHSCIQPQFPALHVFRCIRMCFDSNYNLKKNHKHHGDIALISINVCEKIVIVN